MKQKVHSVNGYVRATITGKQTERFITRCAEEGVRMWHIERKNETTLICYIKLTKIELLRRILKETGCRIHFLERNGIPFFIEKLKKRLGIVAGLLFFLIILLILSNMVWHIEVKGADPKLEGQIRALLKKDHLYVGSLDFFVPKTDQLETRLSSKLTKVTWIGVSKDGTTYLIDVVQKKYPKKQKPAGPRNLVAAKQAIIHHWIVDKGQVVVESNQYVKPGQILVLGRIGREDAPKFVAATGKVIGETWYQSEAAIPLDSRYSVYTGRNWSRHDLIMWKVTLPVLGFRNKPFRSFDKEVTQKTVRFLIWDLPFSYRQTVYREKKIVRRHLSEKKALEEARESADKKLLDRLPPGSEIVSESTENKQIEDKKLIIRSHYVVYENIARPQTIDPAKEKEKLIKKNKADER
ncbi:sporulation protein YqfD [Sporolactobacillus sp. THM7-4]|nr:sporulation protein YqfD [Sporolactobacillus sp. THM7-4]